MQASTLHRLALQALARTEANALVMGYINSGLGPVIFSQPFWEYDPSVTNLTEAQARLAIEWADTYGSGYCLTVAVAHPEIEL